MNTPLLSLPVSVMVLDDNNAFLKGLGAYFEGKRAYLLADNPEEALETLCSHEFLKTSLHKHLNAEHIAELDDDNQIPSFNFASFEHTLYNPNRFSEIGVLVVDYSMPGISGLDFCRQVSHLPLKKIMVTGHAGYDLAVEAFNEGLIDAFILKEPASITEKIEATVLKMQNKYFKDLSNTLFTEPLNAPINAPIYQKALSEFIQNNSLVEYYRLGLHGSYLGLDAAGKAYWFVVQAESDIDNLIDIAQSANAPANIINPLKNKSRLLFLLSEKEKKLPVSNWKQFLLPITQTFTHEGQNYAVSIVKNSFLGLNKTNVKSLKEHLTNH